MIIYREILPSVSANRNSLTGYCVAPETNRNGTIGTGGDSKAEMAIEPNPHRPKISHTLSTFTLENLRLSTCLPPLRAIRYVTNPPITVPIFAMNA